MHYVEKRELLLQVLHTLLLPGPADAEFTTVLLTISLVHVAPECQALALEVLLPAIKRGRLHPAALGNALGRLLAQEFASVPRLTNNLTRSVGY